MNIKQKIIILIVSFLIFGSWFYFKDKYTILPVKWKIIKLADNWAWVWHTDPVTIWNNEKLFFSYISMKNQKNNFSSYNPENKNIINIDISTDKSSVVDSHDHASLTILPDKNIFLSYNGHWKDSWFFFRKTKNNYPKTIDNLTDEKQYIYKSENFTWYSNWYFLKKEKRLYIFMRWLDNKPTMIYSDNLWNTWSNPKKIITNSARRPYVHYASNSIDRIDMIYTDWHPRKEKNSIYHIYYKNWFLNKSNWKIIKSISNSPINNNNINEKWTIIYNYSENELNKNQTIDDYIPFWKAWVWDLEYTKEGLPVAVFSVSLWKNDDFKNIYYYYAWFTKDWVWKKKMIAKWWNSLYKIENDFAGWITIDPNNPSIVYYSSNAINSSEKELKTEIYWNNKYKLYKVDFNRSTWKYVSKLFLENNNKLLIRPFIPAWKSKFESVLWMEWDNYTDMKNYTTSIKWWFSK